MLHSCFPERLKSLRQEKNMLQQDLAEHLKVSKSTISAGKWAEINRTTTL